MVVALHLNFVSALQNFSFKTNTGWFIQWNAVVSIGKIWLPCFVLQWSWIWNDEVGSVLFL